MTVPSRRFDLLLALAGLAGLATFLGLYRAATPQAAVTLDVTREQAQTISRRFVEERGADVRVLKEASMFDGNTVALVFLQRTLGLAEASRWARGEVPIWTWNLRWFRPEQKEEWLVDVGVDGSVARFSHLIEEAATGASLEQDSAFAIAQSFLHDRGWNLGDFERVEASSQKRENRTDHHFTWEKRGSTVEWRPGNPEAGTGAVRLSVDVYGDRIGDYRHFLKVPEDFSRDLNGTLSVGQVVALASLGLTFVLVLLALGIAIARHRHDAIHWRPAMILAGFVALLAIAYGLTSWPAAKSAYPTEFPWAAYVAAASLGLLFIAAVYAIWVLFTAGAGESLARDTFPASLLGWSDAASGRLLGRPLAFASLRGYALAFLLLGYLTAFYLVARKYFGAWLPAEGPHSEIFNNYLPFLAPLTVSLVAATTEELTYRLFGISLIKRYSRSTLLALLVPAMIWAFAHSNYAVFPVYIRGIELTIAGVIFGLGFVYLGLLTCIVAHFVVDAVLIGMPLLTSGNAGYVASGVAVMGIALLPAVVGLVAGRRGRTPGTEPS